MKNFIKNFKLADVIDLVFINMLSFLIFFVWVKFFNKNILVSILISAILLVVFNLLRTFLKTKKKTKQTISKNLEADIEQYMLSLLASTKQETGEFFMEVLKNKSPTLNKKDNIIYLPDTTCVIPYFETQELNLEFCLKNIKKIKKEVLKVVFLCVTCNPKTKNFLEQLKVKEVKVYQKNEIYFNLLYPNNHYPEIMFEYSKNNKFKLKELLAISFNKKRAKSYFLSGTLIFFASFIVRHNFYYVFMSSLLFFFALVCLMKKETSTNNNGSLL